MRKAWQKAWDVWRRREVRDEVLDMVGGQDGESEVREINLV